MAQNGEPARYPSLRDSVVLITGGASGIGAAMVEQFALQRSRVVFLDIEDQEAEHLVQHISAPGIHPPQFVHCDLTDISQIKSAIKKIEQLLGPVRVLVSNAANDDRHDLAEVTSQYWDQRMAINLRHYFFVTQAAVPAMKKAGGGSIVNMSSISWMIPSTGLPAYATAKAAIVGLTRTLSKELGPANIRVNAVSPGAIMTERQRRLWITPEYLQQIIGNQSLKRELVPDDVAHLVLFLASDDSSAITGQNFVIDGGWV